jgi:hypothetical protein
MSHARANLGRTMATSSKRAAKKPPRAARARVEATKTENIQSIKNGTLHAAKAAKQDEFYTQYVDIQKEGEAYLDFDPDTFRGKVVYCNCDDPFESNFFKYFAANFNKLGLKKLITTSYDGSPIAGKGTSFPEYNEGNGKRQKPKALAVMLDHVKDEDGDGAANVTDVEIFLKRNKAARVALKGNEQYPGGDFRSPECVAFLKEADIVVTNPPFSLFREYVALLIEQGKKFLIIGNMNAVTYNEIFRLIKANELWYGATISSGDREFRVPESYPLTAAGSRVAEDGARYIRVKGVRWFTNIEHGRRHARLELMTMSDNLRFNKKLIKALDGAAAAYQRYGTYDAIDVPCTSAIPSDYDGAMGVPITFLDRYNPDQFEILFNAEDMAQTEAYGVEPLGARRVADYYAAGGTAANSTGRRKLFLYHPRPHVPFKRIVIRHKSGK